MRGTREKWIDNIKLIAAFCVFLGHFVQQLVTTEVGAPQWILSVNRCVLGMVLNGEYWVCVFCLLSGYLLSMKAIETIQSFAKNSIKRYFRFCLPLFFANIFVWIVDVIVRTIDMECVNDSIFSVKSGGGIADRHLEKHYFIGCGA